jgi:hypothetical protein
LGKIHDSPISLITQSLFLFFDIICSLRLQRFKEPWIPRHETDQGLEGGDSLMTQVTNIRSWRGIIRALSIFYAWFVQANLKMKNGMDKDVGSTVDPAALQICIMAAQSL